MKSEPDIQTHTNEEGTPVIKPFSELCLMDNYMFDIATLDIETCKAIIEIALHIHIKEIRWKENQKPLPGPPGKRGVRLDFIVVDDEGNWYDVEMQARNVGNLPKRTRFYRARQDSPLLNQGEKGFDRLPPMYIIFICDFDLFGHGKYRYTFKNRCTEVEGLVLEDEVNTVFLNTRGNNPEEVEPELVEFLKFLKDNAGKNTNDYRDNRVRKMYDKIKRLKTIAEMEVDYMASSWWLVEEKEMAFKEGEAKGEARGEAKGIAKGEVIGEAKGEIKGERRMAELVRSLYEAGRGEDALRAATDEEYRRKLYEEFGI